MKKSLMTCLLILLSNNVAAFDEDFSKIRETITFQITQIIRKLDPSASVVVTILPKVQEVKLPSTPYQLKEVPVRNTNGTLVLEAASVAIMTEIDSLPPAQVTEVENLLLQYNVKPSISISKTPIHNSKKNENLGIILSFSGLCVVFVTLLLLFTKRRRNGYETILQSGFSKITSALEENNATPQNFEKTDNQHGSPAVNFSEREENNTKELINEMPLEGLKNLIADCYWSQLDGYAANLWSKISLPNRKNLIESLPYLKEYAQYLQSKNPEFATFHQDSYYLKPLPLELIGNDELTELVKREKSIKTLLSRIRANHLNLSVKERIEEPQEEISSTQCKRHFEKIKPSPLRKLSSSEWIQIRNISEEEELISLSNLGINQKEKIPTLAWLSDLKKESLQDILKKFTAAELATAWIGPPSILTRISECLPEKKMELITSYTGKIKPSRNSPVFKTLHQTSIENLRQNLSVERTSTRAA